MTEQPRAKGVGDGLRRLAAITVATSLLVWWPAFTLGVYGEIFFSQLFALWAAATAAFFVAVLLLGRRAQPAVYSLLLPSVWIVLTWLTPGERSSLEHDVLFWLGGAGDARRAPCDGRNRPRHGRSARGVGTSRAGHPS